MFLVGTRIANRDDAKFAGSVRRRRGSNCGAPSDGPHWWLPTREREDRKRGGESLQRRTRKKTL